MSLRRLLSRSSRKRLSKPAGFTLIELMVVMSIMGLISAVLIAILSQSSALVSQGTTTIGLNQKARTAVDKIGPYIITSASSDGTLALKSPLGKVDSPSADQLRGYKSIQFYTTEDFLNPNYSPRNDWDPNNPTFNYEIYFDNETNPTPYKLENGDTINLGQIILRRYEDSEFVTASTSIDGQPITPQPLAHNVQFFRCHVIGTQNLEIIVHTVGKRKGPQGNLIDVFEEAQAIVNTPAPTYY